MRYVPREIATSSQGVNNVVEHQPQQLLPARGPKILDENNGILR